MFNRIREARENREAMRYAKEQYEKLVDNGVPPEDAGDQALELTKKKYKAIDLAQLQAIIAFIMQLIELFKK